MRTSSNSKRSTVSAWGLIDAQARAHGLTRYRVLLGIAQGRIRSRAIEGRVLVSTSDVASVAAELAAAREAPATGATSAA